MAVTYGCGSAVGLLSNLRLYVIIAIVRLSYIYLDVRLTYVVCQFSDLGNMFRLLLGR